MTNNKQETAVDFIFNSMDECNMTSGTNEYMYIKIKTIIFKQAKEMEKNQIIDAVNNTIQNIKLDEDKIGFIAQNGEGYFNQTYGGNK